MRFTNMTTPPEGVSEFDSVNTVLEAGTVDFSVVYAKESTSQTGNQQLVLFIKLTDSTGRVNRIYDYLPNVPEMYWKTKHFFQTIKKGNYFTQSFNPDDLKGCRGKVVIKKLKETYNNETKLVNKVADYGDASGKQTELPLTSITAPTMNQSVSDDDLPF